MSQPGKIPLHSKDYPISFSNSAKDFLSSPALAYLRGTFHQLPLFCTDWLIFLSCWLHLEKKVIFRTEKLCTGGSLPGYHRESLIRPTFLRAWLWTSSIKCPASIPDLLRQKLWRRDHMHERNEWFLAHPILMSQKEKLNPREVGLGLGHWCPGSNQMSQWVTWLPDHPGTGYSACLLVLSSCCPSVGWLIDSTSLGEESRMARKDNTWLLCKARALNPGLASALWV